MSEERQTPNWREFEQLVALIESHLGPAGAVVRSPDRILDKVTGQPREVDASVRYQVGSVPVLITIECRDRESAQDVRWIEELIAKRDSIGASATVAVSTSGFSRPAMEKARAHGIETRVLREVQDGAIRDWALMIQTVAIQEGVGLRRLWVTLKPAPADPEPRLHPDVKREYGRGDVEYTFIRRARDGRLISIGDVLRDADEKAGIHKYNVADRGTTFDLPPKSEKLIPIESGFPTLFEGVETGGPPVTKVLSWCFDPGEATVRTVCGEAEIESMSVEFVLIQRAYPLNIGRLLSYEGPERAIAAVDCRPLLLAGGRTIQVVISRKAEEPGSEERPPQLNAPSGMPRSARPRSRRISRSAAPRPNVPSHHHLERPAEGDLPAPSSMPAPSGTPSVFRTRAGRRFRKWLLRLMPRDGDELHDVPIFQRGRGQTGENRGPRAR